MRKYIYICLFLIMLCIFTRNIKNIFAYPGESYALINYKKYEIENMNHRNAYKLIKSYLYNKFNSFELVYDNKKLETVNYKTKIDNEIYKIVEIKSFPLKYRYNENDYDRFDIIIQIKRKVKKKFLFFYIVDPKAPIVLDFSFSYFPKDYTEKDREIEHILSKFLDDFSEFLNQENIIYKT